MARYQSFAARSEDDSRAYVLDALADAAENPRRTWDLAVVLTADGRLVGRCGLGLDEDLAQAMLWYTLHPEHWGRGYATEATRALVDFGFREVTVHRIWAECDPANAASWRVLAKLGMRREGLLRENAFVKGAWVDSLIYAVLAREWS